MTYCFNPNCPHPLNPETHRFCQACGWQLRLGDRYEAIHTVGTGQNSRTFLGRDRTTLIKPQCLIKRFTPTGTTRLAQEAAAEQFRKDIVHLAIASRHPYIPNLLSYFERERHQFLVQEFLVGTHLDQHLQDKAGPFSGEDVWALLKDVLPILHHLHGHHIIHRDIKPTNLRRPTNQSHWWLVDLGAVKPLTATRMAQPGTVVGSAEYAAPEQLRGEATFASDLYSLGVVCLHLLTGLHPFDLFDSAFSCWRWRSIVPDVDERLATAIDGMIQPALSARVASVEEVMTALGFPNVTLTPLTPSLPHRRKQWTTNWEVNLGTAIHQIVPLSLADILLTLTTMQTIEVRSLHNPQNLLHTITLNAVNPTTLAAHPHQPTFALGTRQGSLEMWHLTQGSWNHDRISALAHSITQLIFTPDGKAILGADDQGGLHLWDLDSTHHNTWQGHTTAVTALALSHSGTILASGDTQGQVRLWQLPGMECLRTFSRHAGAITALCWLVKDQALVTAGWDVAVLWRCPATGGILQSVKAQGFGLPVRSLLPHPTQPYLITGSQDGQLHCWPQLPENAPTVELISPIATAQPIATSIIGLSLQPATSTPLPSLLCATQTGYLLQRSLPE